MCKKFFDYIRIYEDKLQKLVYYLIGVASGMFVSIIMYEMGVPTGL